MRHVPKKSSAKITAWDCSVIMSADALRLPRPGRSMKSARFSDLNAAMRAYAKQAKNRDLEADAVEIRLRAIRRLDQLRQAQAASIGVSTGGEHGGRRRKIYPVHVMTRKSFGLMTRKLSVTELQRSAQFPGTFSRRKLSVASANWAQVA